MTPPFEPQPYHVVSKNGSNVTIESSDGVQYRRNSSHLKVFNEPKLPETACEQPIDVDKPSDDTEPSEVLPTNQTELDVPTRPTRSRKLPARFNDFELYK
eukprot:gene7668-8504_t